MSIRSAYRSLKPSQKQAILGTWLVTRGVLGLFFAGAVIDSALVPHLAATSVAGGAVLIFATWAGV